MARLRWGGEAARPAGPSAALTTLAGMELIVDGAPIDPDFEIAVRAGVDEVGVPDLTVIYTNDFVGEVRALTLEHAYDQSRGSGTVAARTLTTTTGEVVVVANRRAMEAEGPAAVERVMAHESGHVLIERRGESVDWEDAGTRLPDWWEQLMAYMASIAFDEYRTEATVYDRGYPVERGRTDEGVGDALYEVNADILEALVSEDCKADPRILRDRVLAVMDRLTKVVSCLAARDIHGGGFDPTALNPVAQQHWRELIAPTWERHIAFYRDIPSADQVWGRVEALEAATTNGAVLTNDLLRSIGFYSAGPDGEQFWADFDDATFARRNDRYFADRALRGWSEEPA